MGGPLQEGVSLVVAPGMSTAFREAPPGHRVAVIPLTLVAVLSFSFRPLPIGPPGIDGGWQWVVNVAGREGWAWGKDLVFTYGPLGWLLFPQNTGAHLFLAACFSLLIVFELWWVLVLGRLADRTGEHGLLDPKTAGVFFLLWSAALSTGLRPAGLLVLVSLALCLDALRRKSSVSAFLAGVTTSISVLIKASLGVSCFAVLVLFVIVALRRGRIRETVWALAGFPGGLMLLLPLFFSSVSQFLSWVGAVAEVIGGYSTASSILGERSALAAGFVILILFVSVLVLDGLSRRSGAPENLMMSIPLLISFRLAFVRQDGHQFLFVPVVLGLLALFSLGREGDRWKSSCVAAGLAVVLLGSISGALPWKTSQLGRVLISNYPGASSLKTLFGHVGNREALADATRANLGQLRISPEWTTRIRNSGRKISVIPWEILYAPANDLPFHPLRSTQLYSAYTAKLDSWTAEAFKWPSAPGWILDDFAPVGKRRALLDAPATWRNIWINYDLDDFDEDRGLLLLKNRPEPRKGTWEDLGETDFCPGAEALIPPRDPGWIFAEITAPLGFIGLLNAKFFRVPLILAVFHRDDGSSTWARLIPATSVHGILVSDFPGDISSYAALWAGRRNLPVRRVEILGPGLYCYAPSFHVRWRSFRPRESGSGPLGENRGLE